MAEHGRILVLAGTNGAGKSSLGAAALRRLGGESFDPDAAARRIRAANPTRSMWDANSAAWQQGVRLLDRAIAERKEFVFETTLGGQTITQKLKGAIELGIDVIVWYVGLDSVELHLARVRDRVARGGHDIPEEAIRRRYDQSRVNLVRLLPGLAELHVFDNSAPGDPASGELAKPRLVLETLGGVITRPADLSGTPAWARPIVAAALHRR